MQRKEGGKEEKIKEIKPYNIKCWGGCRKHKLVQPIGEYSGDT